MTNKKLLSVIIVLIFLVSGLVFIGFSNEAYAQNTTYIITVSNTNSTITIPQYDVVTVDVPYSYFNNTATTLYQSYFSSNPNGTGYLYAWYAGLYTINGVENAVFMVNITSSIAPDSSINIYLNVGDSGADFTNGLGAYPTLTSTYGQYDNGANVFTFYYNFAGTSLPSGLTFFESDGTYSVDNELNLTDNNGSGTGYAGIYTNTSANINTLLMNYTSYSNSGGYSGATEGLTPTQTASTGLPVNSFGALEHSTSNSQPYLMYNGSATSVEIGNINVLTYAFAYNGNVYGGQLGFSPSSSTTSGFSQSTSNYLEAVVGSGGYPTSVILNILAGYTSYPEITSVSIQIINVNEFNLPNNTVWYFNYYNSTFNTTLNTTSTELSFTSYGLSGTYNYTAYTNNPLYLPISNTFTINGNSININLYFYGVYYPITVYDNSSNISLPVDDVITVNIPFSDFLNNTTILYSSYFSYTPLGTNYLNAWYSGITNNNATFFIQLSSAVSPDSSTTIYLNIGATPEDTYFTNGLGAYPLLTSTYGQYDNGANVFTAYYNFAGTTIPTGMNAYIYYYGSGSSGNAWTTIDNGATLAFNGGTQYPDEFSGIASSDNYSVNSFIVYVNSFSIQGGSASFGLSSQPLNDTSFGNNGIAINFEAGKNAPYLSYYESGTYYGSSGTFGSMNSTTVVYFYNNTIYGYTIGNSSYSFATSGFTLNSVYYINTLLTSGHSYAGSTTFNYIGAYTSYPLITNITVSNTPESLITVNVNESGLPSGATWYFNITNGQSYSSNTDLITFTITNGTYSYTSSTSFVQIPPYPVLSGEFTTTTNPFNLTVAFPTTAYSVNVSESGLPNGTLWYFNLTNGLSYNTNTTSLTFTEYNGTYTYTATSTSPYYSPITNSFIINGSNVNLNITFNLSAYNVSVSESGLPNGTLWYFNVSNGQSYSTNTTSLTFVEVNGTFDYTATSVNPYYNTIVEPFTVNGSPINISLTFYINAYNITVNESGLPTGTEWYFNVSNGQSYSTNTTSLTFIGVNGTYNYTATSTNTSMTVLSGNFTVNGADITLNLTFSIILNSAIFNEVGLDVGTWTVQITDFSNNTTTSQTSNNTNITFIDMTNGEYYYLITTSNEYTMYSGIFTIDNANITINVSFSQAYNLTVLSSGIEYGTVWYVNLTYSTTSYFFYTITSSNIIISGLQNGTYVLSAYSPNYNTYVNEITVNGNNITVVIPFTLTLQQNGNNNTSTTQPFNNTTLFHVEQIAFLSGLIIIMTVASFYGGAIIGLTSGFILAIIGRFLGFIPDWIIIALIIIAGAIISARAYLSNKKESEL